MQSALIRFDMVFISLCPIYSVSHTVCLAVPVSGSVGESLSGQHSRHPVTRSWVNKLSVSIFSVNTLPWLTLNSCCLLCHLLEILKVIFANSVDPDQTAYQGPHCLPVCKNRFDKFARIFSRQHKQMTFSDAGFLAF